jgi:drug/metabolite transporter (DMT)-like permease
MERRDQTIGASLVLLSTLGFGSLAILSQYAFRAGLDVTTTLTIRFLFASLFAWPVLLVRRQWKVSRRHAVALFLIGCCYIVNSATYFLAIQYAPVSAVTVIFYCYPVVVMILSIAFLGERLTWLRALAMGLALAGGLVMLGLRFSGFSGRGLLLAAVSAIFYALYIVLNSLLTRPIPVGITSTWVMSGMAVAFLLFGLLSGRLDFGFRPSGWPIMLLMVVFSTVLPVQFFLAGVFRIGPMLAAVIGTFEPIVTMVLSALVLGEQIGIYRIAGGALVLGAVLLLRIPVAPRPVEPAATAGGLSSDD